MRGSPRLIPRERRRLAEVDFPLAADATRGRGPADR
jgi:hypothetical protein